MAGRGAPGTPDPIKRDIWLLHGQGKEVDEIADAFANSKQKGKRGTSKRNIYRVLSKGGAPDLSGRWSPLTADPETTRLVLPVLAGIVERSRGRKFSFTNLQVERVATVLRACPDLRGRFAYAIAISALLAERQGLQSDVESLEALLLFTPWRGAEKTDRQIAFARFQRWIKTCRPDWLPRPEGYVGVAGDLGVGPPVGVSLALEIFSALERPEEDDFPRLRAPPRSPENEADVEKEAQSEQTTRT